jgi:hypothetical protein
MSFFPPIEYWCLPQEALDLSQAEMALDGREGNEGIALWLGRRGTGLALVTHVIALRGPGVVKRPDLLQIEPWLLNDVADAAIERDVALVGQIHSHGPGYSTNLSPTDRRYGIAVPGYLSVVAPDFGLRAVAQIGDCGVHVFEAGVGYRRLDPPEIETRVSVIPGGETSLVVIGEKAGHG